LPQTFGLLPDQRDEFAERFVRDRTNRSATRSVRSLPSASTVMTLSCTSRALPGAALGAVSGCSNNFASSARRLSFSATAAGSAALSITTGAASPGA
jgi:hypothetical protein